MLFIVLPPEPIIKLTLLGLTLHKNNSRQV
jgi:hypothetical protein